MTRGEMVDSAVSFWTGLGTDMSWFTVSYMYETIFMADGSVIVRDAPPHYPVPAIVERERTKG